MRMPDVPGPAGGFGDRDPGCHRGVDALALWKLDDYHGGRSSSDDGAGYDSHHSVGACSNRGAQFDDRLLRRPGGQLLPGR